jgi:deoxycytidylate deaminase
MTLIDDAIKIAGRSSIGKHRTGAIIVNKHGVIISNGWSHVPHYKLHSEKRSLHAELHALARARHIKIKGTSIVIATLTRSSNIVNAKPCLDCAIALRAAGLHTAFFTVNAYTQEWIELDHESHFEDLKVYGTNGD